MVRPAEVASRGRLGLSVLRRPAHGCIISQENAQILPVQAPARSRSKNQTTSRPHCRQAKRASPFSRYLSTSSVRVSVVQLALPALVCFAIQIQSKAASPERGLTLPSSGRAFGTPLKSNVRRLWSGSSSPSLKIRATRLPLRRRSAVGAQKSASVYLGAHHSLHSGLGRSCKPISADLRASRFPRIEATIEHARTVLHQSLCFSCAARLPFVGHARSAHIRSCLVIEARARRFSSAA